MIKIYENDEFTIYDYGDNLELYYVWPKDDRLDNYYVDKEHVQRLIKEDANFYGAKQGSEKADDILFALQAHYGLPKYDYDDFKKMNLTQEEVNEAIAYAERDELNKFTYFD